MAGRFSRKKRTGGTSWLLGLVLMLLLVGAIVLGASWVLRAAKTAKPAGIAAAAAERLGQFPCGKAGKKRLRGQRAQNLIEFLRKEIAERHIALVVQTAGNHRAVR